MKIEKPNEIIAVIVVAIYLAAALGALLGFLNDNDFLNLPFI